MRFAANEKRTYLKDLGLSVLPTIGWAERGSGDASGHGNSFPRFHLTWGTGPEVVRVFREPLLRAEEQGQVEFHFRHRVDELVVEDDAAGRPRVVGVRGSILSPTSQPRGEASSRDVVKHFELRGSAVVIATGGIGGNLDKVRRMWPTQRWGKCPRELVTGVPAHVDGRGIDIAQQAGASVVNTDRMWAYTEGMTNWNSIWPGHGIRIFPGPSAL